MLDLRESTDPAIMNLSAPSVTGRPIVGETLTATPGTWSVDGVQASWQWLRNGDPIAGATSDAYTAVAADVGASISVRQQVTKAGFDPGAATSAGVGPVVPGTMTVAGAPSISGAPLVGSTLQSTPGGFTPGGGSIGYQWLRNGAPIPGAVGASYGVTTADRGSQLSVRTTASLAGYTPASATSGPTPPVTQPLAVSGSAKAGRGKATIRVSVAAPGVPAAAVTGKVTVWRGKKKLKTVKIVGGKATIRLTKLKKGKQKLALSYSGGSGLPTGRRLITIKVK